MVSLPRTTDQISREWLTDVLDALEPGVVVESVDVGTILHGSATKVQLRVRFGCETELPHTYYLKGSFEQHGHRIESAYANEVRFYQRWLPKLPKIETPRCYFAEVDRDEGAAVLLFEDLNARGCRFGRAGDPLSIAHATAVLAELAKIHASTWADPSRMPTPIRGEHELPFLRHMFEVELPRGLADDAIGESVPARLRNPDLLAAAVVQSWDGSPITCALHGDAHVGNTYVTGDGKPGLLDFQTYRSGNWAREFSFFTVGSISIEDRRRHLGELLAFYLEELRRLGVWAPKETEAWDTLRRFLLNGLFAWVACPLDMQPREIVKPQVDRFASACRELDALGAFEAGGQ